MLGVLLATQLALSPCKPAGVAETLRCGKLTVFENRAARAGRTIDLNVVVLPALDANGKRPPLFELTGGPGLAAAGPARGDTSDPRLYSAPPHGVLVDPARTGAPHPPP